ncbi:energy-coupled thiamine transporter ThiT [Marinilactibacillus sp. Marseille-P9653]|uniref:energy-coupled thiamine transporter ThiT n=1 Tax=Marinilactibacillus sp. Marseille-P9653 TaxID=2866583 RepID=UPI001CE439FE|nr:energy-coupled thiamine transporter ThiT [Marinilactibacillus sp. Marseille-P9653]
MQNEKLRVYIEGTLFAAIAMILSLIPVGIGASFSVSLGTIPLTFFAIRRGVLPGLFAGFLWGILHVVAGTAYILNIYQFIIEYGFAFTCVGFSGYFSQTIVKNIKENSLSTAKKYLIITTFIGSAARWFWHFVAGVFFFGDYAVWGLDPVTFSLLFNGASMLATIAVTIIVLVLLFDRASSMFVPKSKN